MGSSHAIREKLEEIRAAIDDESISMGEIVALQDWADYIEKNDFELLAWAGVPERHGDGEGCSNGDLFADTLCNECR